MNALEQEYWDNVERSRLRERRRNFLLAAIPWTIGTVILAWRCWDTTAFVVGGCIAIANWIGYATARPRIVVHAEVPTEQPERGYRTPMFMNAPLPPHRPWPERLGRIVGAWRTRRNTQHVIEWERRLEEMK